MVSGGRSTPASPVGTPQPGASEGDGPDEWAADLVRRLNAGTSQLSFRRVITEIPPGTPCYDEGPDCLASVVEHGQLPLDESGMRCGPADDVLVDPAPVEELPSKFEVGPAELAGDNVEVASVEVGQGPGQPSNLVLEFDELGTASFAEVTSDWACDRDQGLDGRFAIVIDGTVESTPGVNPSVACGVRVTGGAATITAPAR